MALRVTGVFVEYVDHDAGHWCRPCAASSGLRIWVAVRVPACGLMHLQERFLCTRCQSRNVEVEKG